MGREDASVRSRLGRAALLLLSLPALASAQTAGVLSPAYEAVVRRYSSGDREGASPRWSLGRNGACATRSRRSTPSGRRPASAPTAPPRTCGSGSRSRGADAPQRLRPAGPPRPAAPEAPRVGRRGDRPDAEGRRCPSRLRPPVVRGDGRPGAGREPLGRGARLGGTGPARLPRLGGDAPRPRLDRGDAGRADGAPPLRGGARRPDTRDRPGPTSLHPREVREHLENGAPPRCARRSRPTRPSPRRDCAWAGSPGGSARRPRPARRSRRSSPASRSPLRRFWRISSSVAWTRTPVGSPTRPGPTKRLSPSIPARSPHASRSATSSCGSAMQARPAARWRRPLASLVVARSRTRSGCIPGGRPWAPRSGSRRCGGRPRRDRPRPGPRRGGSPPRPRRPRPSRWASRACTWTCS